jgi:hypothetical protein
LEIFRGSNLLAHFDSHNTADGFTRTVRYRYDLQPSTAETTLGPADPLD